MRVYLTYLFLFIPIIIYGKADDELLSENISYPDRSVNIVIPYGKGGSTDSTAKALISEVEQISTMSFNVNNISGISGTVGTEYVALAKPDGYTLLFSPSDPFTTQPNILDLSYSLDDFITVAGFSFETNVIAVRADSYWKSIDDLINEKGVLDRGHSGLGGISHTSLDLFFNKAKLDYRDVPFESGLLAVYALLNNEIDVIAGTPGPMIPYFESGKLKALALASNDRIEYFKDVPTLKEKGFDIVVTVDWFLLTPKNTPQNIVNILKKYFMEAANREGFRIFVKSRGQSLSVRDGDSMTEKIQADYDMFKNILQ